MNVALYGPKGRWAMTERRAARLDRGEDHLAIGPSALRWDGAALTATIDEIAVPVPRRVRGRVRLLPAALQSEAYPLDPAARHWWQPLAPCARIEVEFARPALSWRGHAYLDSNHGAVPLAESFSTWSWSRAATRSGASAFYDITGRDGDAATLALAFDGKGGAAPIPPPPPVRLPPTLWRIGREARADPGTAPRILRTLEDAPFYARTLLEARLDGEPVPAIHESLSLPRFSAPWVRALLPFRMPRAF